MYNLVTRKCTSLSLLAPRLKILKLIRRGLNPGPVEPEADMLPSEPTHRGKFSEFPGQNYFSPLTDRIQD